MHSRRILVVEDEPDVRKFLVTCIKDVGFSVDSAIDGVEALEKMEDKAPDLMTLDMVMPRKSGIELIRSLRKSEKWANLPVIVITAHAQDEFGSEDAKRFEAFASHHRPKFFLEKPVTPAKLVKAIGEILEVEIDLEDEGAGEKEKARKLLNETDPETLKKVLEMLDKK